MDDPESSSTVAWNDCGFAGHQYEINLCAYLLLEATQRCEGYKSLKPTENLIDEFYIASNMQEGDLLDDIVMNYISVNSSHNKHKRLMFIQAKHRTSKSKILTLEKLFDSGIIKEYHKAYRNIKELILSNQNDEESIFCVPLSNVEFLYVTNASFRGSMTHLRECKFDVEDLLNFDGKNSYLKIDYRASRKFRNQAYKNVMDMLDDEEDCQQFVEELVYGLCGKGDGDDTKVQSSGKLLSMYQRPILEELVVASHSGVGTVNSNLYADDRIKSPLEKCFIKEIMRKHQPLSLQDIQFTLPKDFHILNKTDDSESILPYSQKYYQEFLDVFKLCINQPDERQVKEYIAETLKQCYLLNEAEAMDTAIIIAAKVRDWWEIKAKTVPCLDKHNQIIQSSVDRSIQFNVKFPTASFTGRHRELEKFHYVLTQNFTNNRIPQLGVAVHGMGGVGKTEFVRQYIQQYRKCFNYNVIWINADSTDAIVRLLQDLIRSRMLFLHIEDWSMENVVKEVFQFFANKECLFVFDNAENVEDLRVIFSTIKESVVWKPYVIITSRYTNWNQNIAPFKLDCLHIEDAMELIKKCLRIQDPNANEDVKALAETLERYPLAIQQAMCYIYDQQLYSNYNIKPYLNDFHLHQAEMLNVRESNSLYDDYKVTTLVTWTMTMNEIASHQEYGHLSLLIFRIAAFCSPNNICNQMFYTLENTTEASVNGALDLLSKYSMIYMNEYNTQFDIHRLVQYVTRTNLQSDSLAEMIVLCQALSMLNHRIRADNLNHAMSVWKYAFQHDALIRTFSNMFIDIISTCYRMSRFIEGHEFATKVIPLVKQVSQYDSNDIFVDVNICFGKILKRLSKFDESREVYEETLSLLENNQIEKKYTIQVELTRILAKQSKFDEALSEFQTHLINITKDLGPTNSLLTIVNEGIAAILKRKGRYHEAMEKFNCILQHLIAENQTPEVKFDIANTKGNIASCLKYLGKYDEALALLNEVLQEQIQEYGEKGHMVLRTLNNIAVVNVMQGKYLEGFNSFHKALDIKKKLYGEKSLSYLVSKFNLATTYMSLPPETWEEGLKLLREVAQERKEMLGLNHRLTLNSYKKYALMLYKMEKYDSALEIIQEVYKETVKLHNSKESPQALDLYRNMAVMYSAKGHRKKALAMLNETLLIQISNKDIGENHPETIQTLYEKANILSAIGGIDEAIEILYGIQSKGLGFWKSNHTKYQSIVTKLNELQQIQLSKLSKISYFYKFLRHLLVLLLVYIVQKLFTTYVYSNDEFTK